MGNFYFNPDKILTDDEIDFAILANISKGEDGNIQLSSIKTVIRSILSSVSSLLDRNYGPRKADITTIEQIKQDSYRDGFKDAEMLLSVMTPAPSASPAALTRYRINLDTGADVPDECGGYYRDSDVSERLDDLRILIHRLVYSLSKAEPNNNLSGLAMDYLKNIGLAGSPLRATTAADAKPSNKTDWAWCFENPKDAAMEIDRLAQEVGDLKHDMKRAYDALNAEINTMPVANADEKRLAWIVAVGWDGLRRAWENHPEIETEDALNELREIIDAAIKSSEVKE